MAPKGTASKAKKVASSQPRKRGLRRTEQGTVVGLSASKTVKVEVMRLVRHSMYGKFVRRSSFFLCHNTKHDCGLGDTVDIVEGRPISASKRWRIEKVVAKAK